MSGFNFGFQNLGAAQQGVMQSIYQGSRPGEANYGQAPQVANLDSFFNERMQAVLQQLSQYTDLSSLQLFQGNIDDAAKALSINNFALTTNAQMNAANIQADWKSGMQYLQLLA